MEAEEIPENNGTEEQTVRRLKYRTEGEFWQAWIKELQELEIDKLD